MGRTRALIQFLGQNEIDVEDLSLYYNNYMISFRVEEAEMLVENKDSFLKTKPMLVENPKTKPITDLKRDFRLLCR